MVKRLGWYVDKDDVHMYFVVTFATEFFNLCQKEKKKKNDVHALFHSVKSPHYKETVAELTKHV